MAPLIETLTDVAKKIFAYKGRSLNEQNTKATLIDPVLRALGWDVEDLEVVHREYKPRKKDNPVDYALLSGREPVLFVEAKALGEDVGNRKWASQVITYASVAGAPWVVLTNGDEYRIYNTHAAVPVERKLFRTISVTGSTQEAAQTLALLQRSRMVGSELAQLWQSHFNDQEVRGVIEELFGTGVPDVALVNIVKKRAKSLSAKDVKGSLARVRVELDFPPDTMATQKPTAASKRKPGEPRKAPLRSEVTLADLIAAGIIRPPLPLACTYKRREFTARIEADGSVTFGGSRYEALSAAAGAARKTVIGTPAGKKYPPTNGWQFWHFTDSDGKAREIAELRDRLVRRGNLKVVG